MTRGGNICSHWGEIFFVFFGCGRFIGKNRLDPAIEAVGGVSSGSTKRARGAPIFAGDAMRALPLGLFVEHLLGPRSARRLCRHGRGDAVQTLPLEPSVELCKGPRNVWGVHRHWLGDAVWVLLLRSSVEPPMGPRSMREVGRYGRGARLDPAGGAFCGFTLFGHEAFEGCAAMRDETPCGPCRGGFRWSLLRSHKRAKDVPELPGGRHAVPTTGASAGSPSGAAKLARGVPK